MLTPPFTVAEFLEARPPELPENVLQEHDRPRASGLGSCARQQAYSMSGTPQDIGGGEGDRLQSDGPLTQEQGRLFEEISVARIERLGLRVVGRQISLPDDYPVSGHPDGALATQDNHDPLVNGLMWGFEHKHLGRWAYERILKDGLQAAEPNYVLQSALYGDALGWDAAQFVIVSQDSSSVRSDISQNLSAKTTKNRWAAKPGIHPKVTLTSVDLRPMYNGLIPVAHERAYWLSEWKATDGDPANVAREFNPDHVAPKAVADGKGGVVFESFPADDGVLCGYCPWLQQCRAVGQQGKYAPALPWTGKGDSDTTTVVDG